MYTLTLTHEERKAIDWIGDRYGHGDNLFHILVRSDGWIGDWHEDLDIQFTLSESAAWAIRDIGEESNFLWDCFCPELVAKLNEFCDKII